MSQKPKLRPFTDAKEVAEELKLSPSYVYAVKKMLVREGKVRRYCRWLSVKMVKQWLEVNPDFQASEAWKKTAEESDRQTHASLAP